jgi:hypothetical protein
MRKHWDVFVKTESGHRAGSDRKVFSDIEEKAGLPAFLSEGDAMRKLRNILVYLITAAATFACLSFSYPRLVSLFSRPEEPEVSEQSEAEEISVSEEEQAVYTEYDERYNPYYGLLNEEEKKLYSDACAAVSAYQEVFEPSVHLVHESVQKVMESVYYDHPEFFWLDTSYSYKYTEDDVCVEITMEFNDTIRAIESAAASFEDNAAKIIREAESLETDLQKEKYVHDQLLSLVDYRTDAAMNQSAYSALVNHESVCAGYARSFQYIMQKMDIPVYYVAGISRDEEHAWNLVMLDGEFYNVDVTWDDASGEDRMFFNRTDEDLAESHERTGLSLQLPAAEGTAYRGED